MAAAVLWLRRVLFSPFGYALRAGRDSVLRADAIGIDVKRMQWAAFVIAGTAAGLAGALYAFSKGSISPESMAVAKSVDGLVMVLLCVLCWPLALLALIVAPLVWLLSLPFRLLGLAVGAMFSLIGALLFLPARLIERLGRG